MFGLGELESAIMDVLWNAEEPAKVRDVLDGLTGREEAAARALRQVLESSGDPEAALLHFASTASDREVEVLRSGLRRKGRRR